MVKFIPVRYSKINYPPYVKSAIEEIPTNFFRENLEKTELHYLSLHTDPGRRWERDKILSSGLLKEFPAIRDNMFVFGEYYCVSKLWFSKEWSKEFSGFLARLAGGIERQRIKVIEVHPPFDAYCDSLDAFIERYAAFEEAALKEFPSAIINIENRYNSAHKRRFGKFLLSTKEDIIELANLIAKSHLKLRLVLDIPQLFSEYYGNELLSEKKIEEALNPVRDIRECISGTHIWGYDIDKKKPHGADFDTYFKNDDKLKHCFLQEVCKLFDDGKARYFVPEVDTKAKLQSIVDDLRRFDIEFVEPL